MDPVADKLMIAAALISLVSLDRLAAWVAMVIIAREFAVSGLRIAAGQQGVVIPASGLGKVKTIVQVAAVLALIAAPDPDAAWVQALVYAMVARDRRLRRGLLPQLQAQARGGLARARARGHVTGLAASASRRARGAGEPLGQLLAARAAHVEHAVEQPAVDVEHGEQQVGRADGVGVAGVGEVARRGGSPRRARRRPSAACPGRPRRRPSRSSAGTRRRRAPEARRPPGRAGAGRAASARPRPRRSGRRASRCRPGPPPGRRPERGGCASASRILQRPCWEFHRQGARRA